MTTKPVELLILKSNERYIRVRDESYELCGLDKASVFPIDQISRVKEHLKKMSVTQNIDAAIYKLLLSEEPYTE